MPAKHRRLSEKRAVRAEMKATGKTYQEALSIVRHEKAVERPESRWRKSNIWDAKKRRWNKSKWRCVLCGVVSSTRSDGCAKAEA